MALVRSIFEHVSVIWRPCSDNLLDKFEKIQRRAVKWILNEQDFHYSDFEYYRKLKDINLMPLKSKFQLNDLILFHKIFYQISIVSFPHYIKLADIDDIENDRLRPNIRPPNYLGAPVQSNLKEMRAEAKVDHLSVKLSIDFKVKVFENSFFVRAAMLWNRLPMSLRNNNCPVGFKTDLTNHLWSTTDQSSSLDWDTAE